MGGTRRRRLRTILAVVVLVPLILIGAFAFYVADGAGALPWQEDPTPIPVVPFQNLGGSSSMSPTATATPGT